ncbi:GreA/GreB family elongation factor [Rhodoferax sp. BAB1]|uniref:GreA/GreB family elongation factor n=1 Tax=Rhodoferax sp. BAB1 TaxID=2741720 RepID=UPI001575AFED|nr:GreA/GreB family elongation factor [Rhodoferax sp. BAB1]QKO21163.1 GreA/GreB family elongation factor [Rhodoferax sp. BAB1]
MVSHPGAERQLTELDFARLSTLYGRPLPEELGTAHLVPSREIAPDIVTMYSQVELAYIDSGHRQKLTLCYPRDAEPALGFVSVLSPIGAALLGLRLGDMARWRLPQGEERCAEVAAILFQPEASGDYTS